MATTIENTTGTGTVMIPNVGFHDGTCGWLATGLADGTISLSPGRTKRALKPGLWIHYPDGTSESLALWNPHGIESRKYLKFESFKSYDCENSFGCKQNLTDAAVEKLFDIAENWVAEQNAIREADAE